MTTYRLMPGDVRETLASLPESSVQCVVTSPPYWGLRDYGTATWQGGDPDCAHAGRPKPRQDTSGTTKRFGETRGEQASKRAYAVPVREECPCGARRVDAQIGLERTPYEFVDALVDVFREVRRVLRDDGTLWLNLGDCYATGAGGVGQHPGGGAQGERWRGGHEGKHGAVGPMTQPNRLPIEGLKTKDLVGVPWRVALALQADGWFLRSDIIWSKPNPMPESIKDRPTKAHEYLFLLAKSERYLYDAAAIAEPASSAMVEQMRRAYDGQGTKEYDGAGVQNPSDVKRRVIAGKSGNKGRTYGGETGDRPDDHLGRGVPWEGVTRNRRTVWTITTQPFPGAHFAVMPEALVEPCILAGSREGDTRA